MTVLIGYVGSHQPFGLGVARDGRRGYPAENCVSNDLRLVSIQRVLVKP